MARTIKTVEDRRGHIMDAALRVFAQKGFAEASTKDIAREAGITPGLIYHYFPSKEALLMAIFEERSPQRALRENPEQLLAMDPEQFFRHVIQHMLAGVESETFLPLLKVSLPEAIHHSEIAPLVTAMISEGSNFMERYLAAKMESGELCKIDPRLVTSLVLGSVMDIALRRQVLHDPITREYTQEQIVESLVSITLRGLLPQ